MFRTLVVAASLAVPVDAIAQDVLTPPTTDAVQAVSDELYANACPRAEDVYSEPVEEFDVVLQHGADETSQPDGVLKLFRVFCFPGVYNMANVFFTWDDTDGLKPLSFGYPRVAVEYKGESDDIVESISITGLSSTVLLTNSAYDPVTGVITSNVSWRGIGDASSGGVWALQDGQFVLQSYYVDGSYDEKVKPCDHHRLFKTADGQAAPLVATNSPLPDRCRSAIRIG